MPGLFTSIKGHRFRLTRCAVLVLCLFVSQSVLRPAHHWQNSLHAVLPVTPQHHQAHHEAGHFDDGHSHTTDADNEHHREHHAEQSFPLTDFGRLSSFCSITDPSRLLCVVSPVLLPVRAASWPEPVFYYLVGRDGRDGESPPAQYLSLPLAGRSPPVA